MANTQFEKLTLENQRIGFLNFEGRDEYGYNENKNRSFWIFLEDEALIDYLVENGYNVKFPDPTKEIPEGSLPPSPRLEVTVSKGQMVNPRVKVYLREEEGVPATLIPQNALAKLDKLRYSYADVVINPYAWELKSGKKGTKAYLSAVYLNLRPVYDDVDEFAAKYGVAPQEG